MSKVISCEVDIDIDVMRTTAQNMGWGVHNNAPVRGFYGQIHESCDLVIYGRSHYPIGFVKDSYGAVTTYYDDMADRDLKTIMPEYKIEYSKNKLMQSGFSDITRQDTEENLILWVKRR